MEDGHKIVDPFFSRGRNQLEEHWGYFAVYDGHGGREEVDYCEARLHDVVLGEVRVQAEQQTGSDGVKSALVSAFHKIDSQLAMLGAWKSGTTATVALVRRIGNSLVLHVANVGDSRAILVGSNGSSRRVSYDHKACDPGEAARVAQDGGVVRHNRVGGSLSVSRSLGDHHLKGSGLSCVPDVFTCETDGETALVIASDGLWDVLEDEEAGGVLNEYLSQVAAAEKDSDPKAVAGILREGAARNLVNRAKEKGSRDNILCLVIFF